MPFSRVSRDRRCPICKHADWCLVANDGCAAICARVESRRRVQRAGRDQAGWLHILDNRPKEFFRPVRLSEVYKPVLKVNWQALASKCETELSADKLCRFASSLGLSSDSLRRLNVGWHYGKDAYTFPMRDHTGIAVGIRLRKPDGFKFAVKGSMSGLFVPEGIDSAMMLFVAEGPTDTAALLDMGLIAVGRPSCTGGVAMLIRQVQRLSAGNIVIVADGDKPGQDGAKKLASGLSLHSPTIRIITPPAGIKDARAWHIAGATTADIMSAVESAPIHLLRISLSQRNAI